MKKTICLIACLVLIGIILCSCDQASTDSCFTDDLYNESASVTSNIESLECDTVSAPTIQEQQNSSNNEVSSQTSISEIPTQQTYSNTPAKVTSEAESSSPEYTISFVEEESEAVVHEYSDMELSVFELINTERINNGVAPLKLSQKFYCCAQIRASEAAVLWSHTRPNNKEASSVIYDYGMERQCRLFGENLGRYFKTTQRVMQALMESDGHRKNILNSNFTEVAISIIPMPDNPEYYVMSQIFISNQ